MLRFPQKHLFPKFWRILINFPEFWQKFDRIFIIQRFEWFGRSRIESFNSEAHGADVAGRAEEEQARDGRGLAQEPDAGEARALEVDDLATPIDKSQ